jgi:kynurenine formamidase
MSEPPSSLTKGTPLLEEASTSPYGPLDRVGAANEIDAAKVLQAAALVREGRRYDLSQILDDHAPTQMWRYWKHTLVADRAIPERALGSNLQTFVEESVAGALHSGTHLDGLGHIGIGQFTYNGLRYADIIGANGLNQLGIESVPPLFSRGVLLNLARLHGVEMLGPSQAVGEEDLEGAVEAQQLQVGSGDILLLHTGWGKLWEGDPEQYKSTEPGLDLGGAAWCTRRRVAVIGADNWAIEVVPSPREGEAFPVHQHCLTRHGCYLLENVRTEELAREGVQEFCCVVLPNRLRGASASIVSPLAVC